MLARPFAALLLAGSAVPALAQANAQADPAGVAATPGEIIVTAQKRAEREIDVPITLSANTGERLRELGVGDLDELAFYVPGLNIQEQSANNPGIVIRGITSDSGSAQQAARVTVYYNGVDISRSRGVYQDLYDVERIEVVKGPQATLFGTASTIGAVSIISARPREGFSGELTGGIGNYDGRFASGFVNVGSDVFAVRLAGAWKRRDGYVENLAPNQDDLNGQNQLGARGSLRWTPTADLTFDLILTYDRQRNPGTAFVSRALPTSAGPGNPFGVANLGGSPFSAEVLGLPRLGLKRDVYDINFTANWELQDDVTLTTISAYREFDSLEVFDADGSAAFYLEFAEDARGHQFNHETRVSYNGERFRGFAGFNYFREDGLQRVPFSSNQPTFVACATSTAATRANCVAPNGTVPTASPIVPYQSVFQNSGDNDQWSVFADGTFIPTPSLELTAGARVLIEKRRSAFFASVPRTAFGTASLIPTQVDTGGQTFRNEDSFAAVLPRFNILFRAAPGLNLYGTVAKGRRSPVVQVAALRTATGPVPDLQSVGEERVWNYEIGAKLSSGIVSGSVGAFWQEYEDFQVSVVEGARTVTRSAGSATQKGVEAELNLRPTEWLSLFGNVAYIDGGIDDRSDIAPTFRGARFRLQPKWQAAGGVTLDAPLGGVRLFATPSVTHRSGLFFELPNSPATFQGPVTLVNLRAGLSFGGEDGRAFEVAGFARNLFDEEYLLDAGNTGGAFGIPTYIPAEPRIYGVQASVRF